MKKQMMKTEKMMMSEKEMEKKMSEQEAGHGSGVGRKNREQRQIKNMKGYKK